MSDYKDGVSIDFLPQIEGEKASIKLEATQLFVDTISGKDLVPKDKQRTPEEAKSLLLELANEEVESHQKRGLTLKGLKKISFGQTTRPDSLDVSRELNLDLVGSLAEHSVVDVRRGAADPTFIRQKEAAAAGLSSRIAAGARARIILVGRCCFESDACQCSYCEDCIVVITCW